MLLRAGCRTTKSRRLRSNSAKLSEAPQASGNELYKCLPALKDFMKENQDAAFGLDFPFGLPEVLELDEK